MADYSNVLLTVDFDRTLTGPDSTIPSRNLQAIRHFMEQGGAFTVNTGRSVPMYSRLIHQVPVNAPLLLYNGGAAYDPQTGHFPFLREIPLDWRETIRRVMEQFPENPVELQGVTHHHLFAPNERWRDFCIHEGCPWKFSDFHQDLSPFLKFTVYGEIRDVTVAHLFQGTAQEFQRMDQIQQALQEAFGDECAIFRSANRLIDLQAKGISKASSARWLQRHLNREILVCVGDGENDVDMLRDADFAFCPGDAAVRDWFDTVCSCGEGAVADVIEKKIPKILG